MNFKQGIQAIVSKPLKSAEGRWSGFFAPETPGFLRSMTLRALFILCFFLLLTAGAAIGANSTPTIRKLFVVGDHGCPPYEFLENGQPTGFNVELMRAVAEVTGLAVEFRLRPWIEARQDLEEGRIDALSGMYYSLDRSTLVNFSVPHTMVSSGVFVRKDSPIRSYADIQGKEIIVQEGDIIHDSLRRNGLASRIVAVREVSQVLELLATGKHDCALMPSRLQGEHFVRTLGKRIEEELQKAHDELERRVEQRTAELARTTEALIASEKEKSLILEEKVREEVAKNRGKDVLLIQQNRQAAMGELLDHIAHQWKQPLTVVSLLVQNLEGSYGKGELTPRIMSETTARTLDLLEHMGQTIEVFRDFYRPDKEKTVFSTNDAIDSALEFISPALRCHAITVEFEVEPGLMAMGYPREYTQVLLNVLSNARDALRERGTVDPKIVIRGVAEGNDVVVTITDNAGGIPDPIFPRIFDLYVTTKEASGGTGIGLHMSKNIIEKNMQGSLTVHNLDSGAQFRIAVNMAENRIISEELSVVETS